MIKEKKELHGETAEACGKVLKRVSGAVACGVVDLKQKRLLAIRCLSRFSREEQEALIPAVIKLLRGSGLTRLEKAVWAGAAGMPKEEPGETQEIQMTFQGNTCFAKTVKEGQAAIFLVTKRTGNIGMAWVQLKSLVPAIASLIS